MPLILRNLSLLPADDEAKLPAAVAATFRIRPEELLDFRIIRKGVDARKKPRVILVYTVSFTLSNETAFWERHKGNPNLELADPSPTRTFDRIRSEEPVVIAGMGPAGIFCALRLAAYGIHATIVERGRPVEERVHDVSKFWTDGTLDTESNVQFGEGGAGTFSDGKLTCRLRDPNTAWVLDELVRFGAPHEIRYLAKPHIGTDRLRIVVSAIRRELLEKGASIRFSFRLTGIASDRGKITAVRCNDAEELKCSHLVLATGHSARDTYSCLSAMNLRMEQKPFAIGLRVEHPQELINMIQYGKNDPGIPKADYALTYNNSSTGRSCYSFCMCPGGIVMAGSSEAGMVVTNGMSNLGRDSGLANSALVVNVRGEDFGSDDPLAGVRFQQKWERLAFEAGGGNYSAPAQNLLSFIGKGKGTPRSSYHPGTVEHDLASIMPKYIAETLKEGIASFDRKMKGFVTREATLTGVETRTSAPLRILRGDDLQSPEIIGLYPCGEGAGYAGGIMSAALDGIRVADKIAEQLRHS